MTWIRLAAIALFLPATIGAQTAPRQLTIAPDLRIDGNANDLVPFGRVLVRRDGVMAIWQQQDRAVRFFSPVGAPLAKMGRRGQGPGEFDNTNAVGIGWVGDSLWINDPALNRISIISPSGAFVRNVSLPSGIQPGTAFSTRFLQTPRISPRALNGDGSFLFWIPPITQNRPPQYDSTTTSYVRVGTDGVVQSIVARIPIRKTSMAVRTGPQSYYSGAIPFTSGPTDVVADEGTRVAVIATSVEGRDAGTFRVTMLGVRGDTTYSRSYTFPLERIPARIADSAKDVAIARVAAGRASDAQAQLLTVMRTQLEVPPAYQPFTMAFIGRDGSLWFLKRPATDGYFVIDPRGEPYAHVVLPTGANISTADLQNAWGYEADKDGVQSVVRYRLVPR